MIFYIFASVVYAQNAAQTVTTVISGLPVCAQTCIFQLPGVTNPVTDATITAICGALDTVLPAYNICITAGCTNETESTLAKSIGSAVPPLCAQFAASKPSTVTTGLVTATATSEATTSIGKGYGKQTSSGENFMSASNVVSVTRSLRYNVLASSTVRFAVAGFAIFIIDFIL